MSQPLNNPEIIDENRMSIHTFLNGSYDHAKKQIGHGVSMLQDGMSYIKDEFSSFYDKTGTYITNMLSPVNNFLKDLSQIETEFQQEEFNTMSPVTSCTIIPIEVALQSPMEENY